MIILDTNVVSEPLRKLPDPVVLNWISSRSDTELYLTSISHAELLAGVAILPDGRRKRELSEAMEHLLMSIFADRILAFDRDAAVAYASIRRAARAKGLAIETLDCQIAAIALTQGFTVATRDTAPFLAAGLNVINPWTSA